MQKFSLGGTKPLLQLCACITTPPLSKSYKDSTSQKVEIHKSTQFYLYQISRLPVNKNLCKTNPITNINVGSVSKG